MQQAISLLAIVNGQPAQGADFVFFICRNVQKKNPLAAIEFQLPPSFLQMYNPLKNNQTRNNYTDFLTRWFE